MEQTYTISALAEEFAVTPRTLRFYEAEGLLSPRREGQRRIYSRRDYVRLKLILRGKRLGLSLAESKEIIDLYGREGGSRAQIAVLREKIAQYRHQLEDKRRDIDASLEELDRVERLLTESPGDNTVSSGAESL